VTEAEYLERLNTLCGLARAALTDLDTDTSWTIIAELLTTMVRHGPQHRNRKISNAEFLAQPGASETITAVHRVLDELRKRGLAVEMAQ
jgi:hypothetical protein